MLLRQPTFALQALAVGSLLAVSPAAAPAQEASPGAPSRVELPDGFDQAASDPRAVALAMSGIEALGGWDRWQSVNAMRFTFSVERGPRRLGTRTHYWDRPGGRHRVEMSAPDGAELVVTRRLQDGEWTGQAARNGLRLDDEEALAQALDRAREAWVNDAHWLLMPFRAFEPGARLEFAGRRTLEGRTYYLVKLTFDRPGRTPGDAYWAWYNASTRRMDIWQYRLWSAPPRESPSTFRWLEWTDVGGLKLSLLKEQLDLPYGQTGLTVRFKDVQVLDGLPDRVFDPATAAPAVPSR